MRPSRFSERIRKTMRGGQALVLMYLAAMFAELVLSGLWMSRTAHDYGLPEWLINYQGGFLRRGLTGEMIRQVSRLTHVPGLLLAAILGIICYGVLFFAVRSLLATSSWRWWVYALAVCPATFAFPVIARTSFRKDVLFFALLAGLLLWLRRRGAEESRDLRLSAVLALVLPVLVLCQEPLFVYFPYCIAALRIFVPSWKRIFRILIGPAILAGAALIAVSIARGNPEQVEKVCASLSTRVDSECPAGVRIAGAPALDVARFIREYGYWEHYSLDLVLCLIPLAGAYLALRKQASARPALRAVVVCAAIAALGSISLFAVGVDWGRWINLHMISLALLLFALDAVGEEIVSPRTVAGANLRGGVAIALAVLLVCYATCWSMPGNRNRPLFGYVSLGKTLLSGHRSFTD